MPWRLKTVRMGVGAVLLGVVSFSLEAKTHVMGRNADPWVVPAWEDVFDEGPFDLPAGATRETPAAEALRLGWIALHSLDDREAERAFRLTITKDETNAVGCLGLALANEGLPGRAMAFANRADTLRMHAPERWQPLIQSYAAAAATRGPARRPAELVWVRDVRRAWSGAPAGQEKDELAPLVVRALARVSLLAEARLRLMELLESAPNHPARAYGLWLAASPVQAQGALASVPVTPGAHRAAGEMLERLGRPDEAAGWYAAAGALAGHRHPSDMEDWRMVEEMRRARVRVLASSGQEAFPEELPIDARVEAWLRLEAWDRLAALPGLPAKAPLRDRLAVAHARALSGFVQGRLPAAHGGLAEVQQLLASARTGQAGITLQELPAFEALELELQMHNLATRGAVEEARGRFAQLRHIPAARAARLALALDLPLEAMKAARQAAFSNPHSLPETKLFRTVAEATQQRLPEDFSPEAPEWPPLPTPPEAAPLAAAGQLPGWSLTGADGVEHTLASLQDGQPTVVLFFLGHECVHCMNQLRTFDPVAPRFAKAGARLVAISADGPDGVAKTFASLPTEAVARPFTFPVLADPDRRAFAPWGVMDQFYGDAIHGVFVFDGSGRLRWRHLGVEPYMMVSDVLAAVEEMGAAP